MAAPAAPTPAPHTTVTTAGPPRCVARGPALLPLARTTLLLRCSWLVADRNRPWIFLPSLHANVFECRRRTKLDRSVIRRYGVLLLVPPEVEIEVGYYAVPALDWIGRDGEGCSQRQQKTEVAQSGHFHPCLKHYCTSLRHVSVQYREYGAFIVPTVSTTQQHPVRSHHLTEHSLLQCFRTRLWHDYNTFYISNTSSITITTPVSQTMYSTILPHIHGCWLMHTCARAMQCHIPTISGSPLPFSLGLSKTPN